ncbi:MAG TPA: response regulator [Luteibaculaceae bacterium]|nr:response regulator [Luteibaculaceae bacterium]
MDEVFDFFFRLFDTESWPPRWHCGSWTSFHGWLYILSDLAIWSAYFAIPTALFFLLRRKKDLPLPRIFWLFMAFILLCGITHLMDAIIFYWPAYRLSAVLRFLTAVVSWTTVFSLARVLPEVVAMRTSAQFESELEHRKLIEQELLQAKEVAEKSRKMGEQFLANMSHEIRTPLNAILGFAEQLKESKLDESQKEFIDVIQKAGDNLLVIINDILDLAKIESGAMVFEMAPLNIQKELEDIKRLFGNTAQSKGIRFEIEHDPRIPEWVVGDSGRLWQILMNLTSNAVKFTRLGQVTVKSELVLLDSDNAEVNFYVSDTGVGISPDKIASIFDPFTQAEASTTREFGGTGLGLTIVKHLVELQDGTIIVQSKLGQGSTFRVNMRFRVGSLPEEINEQRRLQLKQAEQALAGMQVLLVEDNAVNRRLVEVMLAPYGVVMSTATNGVEALDLLKLQKFDLVLMDIQMPIMDGYTTTQRIRQDLRLSVPIMALTAHALAAEQKKCLNLGMNDFVSKPIRKEELLVKMMRYARPIPPLDT